MILPRFQPPSRWLNCTWPEYRVTPCDFVGTAVTESQRSSAIGNCVPLGNVYVASLIFPTGPAPGSVSHTPGQR